MIYIKSNLSCLPLSLKNLQEQNIIFGDTLKIIEVSVGNLMNLEGNHKIWTKKKLNNILDKNVGHNIIISKVLSGK